MLCALLLEPMTSGMRVFRRVGTINLRGRCPLEMRYRWVMPGESDGDAAWDRLWEAVTPNWGDPERGPHENSKLSYGPRGALPVNIRSNRPLALYIRV